MKFSVFYIGLVSIAIICASRFLPHLPNFTPVIAGTVFLTYWLKNKHALIISALGIIVSDLVLNNTLLASYQKGFTLLTFDTFFSILSIICIYAISNWKFSKMNVQNVLLSTIIGSILFYAISNFGVWATDQYSMYTNDIPGLLSCYILGLPFITLPSDLFYTVFLFVGYFLVKKIFEKKAIIAH